MTPRSKTLIDITNFSGIPLLIAYSFAMFIYPCLAGDWDWNYIQAVWDRWQTLNAGALAFLASLVAFNISRYTENSQREREFISARAFLPFTLSNLMEYCVQCAAIYDELWAADGQANCQLEYPGLTSDYRDVFSNCIRYANPEVGSHLSKILVKLQVHEARLRDVVSQSKEAPALVTDRINLFSYMYRLGELHALAGNLFHFARGEKPFEAQPLNWEDFQNSYGILNLELSDLLIDEKINLKSFTQRAIARGEESMA